MENSSGTESNSSLAGYHVLVTRPADRVNDLREKLSAFGAHVHCAPLLIIEPLPESPELRGVAQNLDQYDVVIVTSVNAVSAFMLTLANFWPQWPVGQRWMAVGSATASALGAYGINAVFPDDATSEGLLALAELKAVAGSRILLVAGEGGRDLLEKTLTAGDAKVNRIATYRRIASVDGRVAIDAFRDIAAVTGKRVALVTSAEALQNLLALAPWLPASNVIVIVSSARIADAAARAGIHHITVAAGATDRQQLDALLQLAAGAH